MCTTNLYKLSLCVEVPPFHWIDDYRKKFREYILLTRSPSKYFSTFQKLFEDVYICYCCCFYRMCLRCFLLPWTIFSSVQNGRFGENLQNWIMHFSLYYCFLYIPIWIIWYIWYSVLYNVPNISEVLRNVYGLYSSFHSLLNSLQILSQRKIVENDTCIKMLL